MCPWHQRWKNCPWTSQGRGTITLPLVPAWWLDPNQNRLHFCMCRSSEGNKIVPGQAQAAGQLHVSILSPSRLLRVYFLSPSWIPLSSSCQPVVSLMSLLCAPLVLFLSSSCLPLVSLLSLSCLLRVFTFVSILSPSCPPPVSLVSPSCLPRVSLPSLSCLLLVSLLLPSYLSAYIS